MKCSRVFTVTKVEKTVSFSEVKVEGLKVKTKLDQIYDKV